jgi:hypothetical protein
VGDKAMTNLRDVAEKITNQANAIASEKFLGPKFLEWLESILREVAQEAILDDRMKRTADGIYALSRSAARAEALDECRKIADQHCLFGDDCDPKVTHCRACQISVRIRALRFLFVPWPSRWNAWVRYSTAWIELKLKEGRG